MTRKDAYPVPRIDETLDTLAGSCIFTTLDLLSGYWQVEVQPEDREKTAVCTPDGLFEFKGELHRFSTLTYIKVQHERTFSAKCGCLVQFRSREITRNFCTNSPSAAILNTSLVPTRGERHEQRMADDVEPYQFETLMTAEELSAYRERVSNRRDDDSDGENVKENYGDSRIGNNSWCSCGRCVAMPTVTESLCCNELREARDKMGQNACITLHAAFERVCLDPDVLETALVLVANVRFHSYSQPIQNKTYRLAAYRQFTYWTHSRLGRHIRRVIPACVVNQVRLMYSEPSGQYIGYQEPLDIDT